MCPHCQRLASGHNNDVPETDFSEFEMTVAVFSSTESETDACERSVGSDFNVNADAPDTLLVEPNSYATYVGDEFTSGSEPETSDDEKTHCLVQRDISNVRNPNSVCNDHALTAGWLICIKGVNKGRDYKIHIGRNTSGSGEENSIAVLGDNAVSKAEQVIIIYNPENNRFFAWAGSSQPSSYLNGKLLLDKTEVKKNDVLELGNTRLMLIPCCDENFDWGKFPD